MTRKTFQLALAATALIFAFTITGCQKQISNTNETEDPIELTMQATEDDAEADLAFSDIGEQAMGVDAEIGLGQIDLFNGGVTDGESTGVDFGNDPVGNRCFTITVVPKEPLAYPKTITIDYGTGCKGRDGKVRSGKIITVYTKPLIVPGAMATTEFNNYYCDSVKVEGKHIIKNNSTSAVLVITRIVQNGKLTKKNGCYIKWNAEHTNTQVAGLGTPGFPRDDEWNITGGARGEVSCGGKSNSWSRLIVEPLHKAFVCRWIDKGVVKITRNDQTALLNFGDGTCDNKAVIIKDGVIKEITLK
jgi:hypothetical protein